MLNNNATNIFELDEGSMILRSFLDRIVKFNFPEARKTSKGYNFRCNVCGDSWSRKKSKQGWLLSKQSRWSFYCHCCHASMPAGKWMQEYFSSDYKDYILELFKLERKQNTKSIEVIEEVKVDISSLKNNRYVDLSEQDFVPIEFSNNGLFKVAQDFCTKRNIPYDIWKTWYIAFEGTYKHRLIIPFYETLDKIFYFQGRTLVDNPAKYINYDLSKSENIILYNKFGVDYEKPIMVTEGPIDSLFLENAIAVLSTNIDDNTQKFLDGFKCYYLFDCDIAGRKKSLEYIRKSKYVFLWKKFINDYRLIKKDKWDINDVILYLKKDNFTFSELEKYFSNNILNSMFI